MPTLKLPDAALWDKVKTLSQKTGRTMPAPELNSFSTLFRQDFSQAQLDKPQYSCDIAKYHVELLTAWLDKNAESRTTSWKSKVKYVLLLIGGTLYFGCEGFDGITALLGVVSVPAVVLLAAGIVFALLSIIVFYSFDLVEIAANLGVKSKQAPQLVNYSIQELGLLRDARHKIMKAWHSATPEELEEYRLLLAHIQQRYEALAGIQDKLNKALQNPFLKTANYAVSAAAGILFFSGGFFAGQTVALTLAAMALGTTAVSPAFLPVLAFSVLIGVAALSIYWYVERPGIEAFVGRWFKLDKEAITQFCDKDLQDKKDRTAVLYQAVTERLQEKTRDESRYEKAVASNGMRFFDTAPSDARVCLEESNLRVADRLHMVFT